MRIPNNYIHVAAGLLAGVLAVAALSLFGLVIVR
jgi:hypothetical protein